MAKLLSLCNDIEQFLQQTDENARNQLLHWLKYRLNISDCSTTPLLSDHLDKSVINTSQVFLCQCGHRYSLHFAMTDESHEQHPPDSLKTQDSSRVFLCTKCQIRLHTRETFLSHYSMHQQGFIFCKRCFQFYNHDQMKSHDCEQRKIDELQSLEQLIPPDTNEQQSNPIAYADDHDTSSSARIAHSGLPKLTDSITEVRHPDGKRQFRCPLCLNSYVNRSGLNRHYITHSSQDLWKVECQYCGKRYSRKDSLKHHMKTQHAQFVIPDWTWKEKSFQTFNDLSSNVVAVGSISSSSNEKEHMENDDVVLVT